MALTFARNVPESENIVGRYRADIVDFTLDASYPALGYVPDPDNFGFKVFYTMSFTPANVTAGSYNFAYDTTNKTIRVFVTTTGVEVATGASLAGVIIRALILGF